MNAVAIGPFAFSIDRLAVIMGVAAFLIAGLLLSRRSPPHFQQWATHALLGGIVGARLGHVVRHFENFAAEPWRILAFWQGGFAWEGAAVGVLLSTMTLAIRTPRLLPRAALALGAFVVGWAVTSSLALTDTSPPAPLNAFSGRCHPADRDRRPTRTTRRGQSLGNLVPALPP